MNGWGVDGGKEVGRVGWRIPGCREDKYKGPKIRKIDRCFNYSLYEYLERMIPWMSALQNIWGIRLLTKMRKMLSGCCGVPIRCPAGW